MTTRVYSYWALDYWMKKAGTVRPGRWYFCTKAEAMTWFKKNRKGVYQERGNLEGEIVHYEIKQVYIPHTSWGLRNWINKRIGQGDIHSWDGKWDWIDA